MLNKKIYYVRVFRFWLTDFLLLLILYYWKQYCVVETVANLKCTKWVIWGIIRVLILNYCASLWESIISRFWAGFDWEQSTKNTLIEKKRLKKKKKKGECYVNSGITCNKWDFVLPSRFPMIFQSAHKKKTKVWLLKVVTLKVYKEFCPEKKNVLWIVEGQ